MKGSEPEPDTSWIIGTIEDFGNRHPDATAVALVVEVADGTLRQDRGIKRRIYAEASIRTYWIVNLVDRVIEVYADPSPADKTYGPAAEFRPGQHVPVVVAGQTIGHLAVDDVLP